MPIHLKIKEGELAENVIVAGDPKRVRHVSELLESARLVNENRGLIAYTGEFNGKPISVVTHGVGAPSALAVFEELIQLGAKRIVRLGTCGALIKGAKIGDIIVPTGAFYYPGGAYYQYYREWVCGAAVPDYDLLSNIVNECRKRNVKHFIGPVVSSDAFYAEDPNFAKTWSSRGAIGVEMECASLFLLGLMRHVKTAAVLMVSDSLLENLGFADANELREYARRTALIVLNVLSKT